MSFLIVLFLCFGLSIAPNVVSGEDIVVNVDGSLVVGDLTSRFWASTGLSPPDGIKFVHIDGLFSLNELVKLF